MKAVWGVRCEALQGLQASSVHKEQQHTREGLQNVPILCCGLLQVAACFTDARGVVTQRDLGARGQPLIVCGSR